MVQDLTAADPGRTLRRWLAVVWTMWCGAVLICCYPKLGHLVASGPSAWRHIDLTDGHLSGLRSFPAWHEAAARAGRGALGALLVLMAGNALGTGVCAAIRWRGDDWRERLLFRSAAGYLVLSESSIALAYLHLYRRPVVAGLVVAAAGFDAWIGWRAWKVGGREIAIGAVRRLCSVRHDVVWKGIVGLALAIALIGALAPEREFDALWFHLEFPRRWFAAGHLIQPPTEYVSLYPMSWETIYGAGLAVGGQIAAKLVQFACLPLTALLVHQATRRSFPRAKPWLAAALLVTAPTILWEATTAYLDLSGALFVGLAGYALLRYGETRSRPWLVMAGVTIGMALASKDLALLAVALLAALLVIGLRRSGLALVEAVRSGALFLVVGLCAALPWYVHSWLASGNPVFPEGYGFFGAPADRWNAAADQGLRRFTSRFGVSRTPLHLLTLPWSMVVHAARFGGTFGPLFLLLLPALALLRGRPTRWYLAFAVGYAVVWASPLSTFQLRWPTPVVPVMAVLGAEAASRLRASVATSRRGGGLGPALLAAGLAAVMLINLPPLTPYQEADRTGDLGWLTGVMRQPPLAVVIGAESAADYLGRAVPSSRAWRYLDHHSPASAVVLTLTEGGDNFLTARRRVPYDAVVAQPAVGRAPVGRERQALVALDRLGVSYVLFDRWLIGHGPHGQDAIAAPRALACWYDTTYDDGRFIVGRLRWPRLLAVVRAGASPWLTCAAGPR